MGDLGDFAARMRKKASRVEPEVLALKKLMVLGVVTDVAQATPILTGQAQSNWLTNVGSAMPFYKANEDDNGAWHEAVDWAHIALQSATISSDIHITNNVPYIVKLNQGSSKQAPAMFVQLAVLRARYKFRGTKINLG